MGLTELAAGQWLALARHELLLFAGSLFLLGALDEIVVDLTYLWLRLTGRIRTPRIADEAVIGHALTGRCAVFLPAWQESAVIGATIAHAMAAWPQVEVRFYLGCYRNDEATCSAAREGAAGDPRLRLVHLSVAGPTCKADCLNHLYRALAEDEAREDIRYRMVVLHDAEDMVDPAAIAVLDDAIGTAAFVQLPVLALPQRGSPWVSGHYSDEFAESHTKAMVVRSAMGQGIPGAGVGCAVARGWLSRLDARRQHAGPFATGALTEDYELGLEIARMGGITRFLRMRSGSGRLIATRAYFPHRIGSAIRQKARWIHGIAFQSWDRRGWHGSAFALWMQLRDRRGPLAALLLALAYVLLIAGAIEGALRWAGVVAPTSLSPTLRLLLWCNLAALVWRLALRAVFTTREFGAWQGLLAVPRVVVSNTIAIVAARRALGAYVAALRGGPTAWDKTDHTHHPAHDRAAMAATR